MTDSNDTPPVNNDGGVVDVTLLAAAIQSGFITWATAAVFGLEIAIPGLGEILAMPVAGELDRAAISFVLNQLANAAVMQAFFINTALRKASQAQDFQDAVNAVQNFPAGGSDADYQKLEAAEIAAFNSLVVLGN